MSKRGYISRYLLILKKLKARPFTSYEDLKSYIENQVDYLQMRDDTLVVAFSKRTLQRDIKEIRNIFGIDVEHSKVYKGYFIVQSEMENMNFQRMLEAFDMFNSLNIARDMTPFVYLENRRPQGTDNLYGLLHAIKNGVEIRFRYQKFWDDEPSQRLAAPYALKEFRSRWYVLAKDNRDQLVKSFSLDRLTELEITSYKFAHPIDYKFENLYRHSFGIINPINDKPSEVILSFDSHQGKYIKTLPLHESQKVLLDTEDELQISLYLYTTIDFIMELLSHGENVKVLKPESLANEMKELHRKAFMQY